MNYSILDPTGNITAIITQPTEPDSRQAAAAEVMAAEKTTEQVGFLLPGGDGFDGELQMAGGEFCGNASMSAAAEIAMRNGMQPGEKCTITLRVSGADGPVPVELEAVSQTAFMGRVSMPRALEIVDVSGFPVVMMPGIAHGILPESFGIENAEKKITLWCDELKADAMGLMLVDDDLTRITPIVYVPGAGTLVRENSCASGTAAVGAYLAAKLGKSICRSLKEPGGTLTVEAVPGGEIHINGCVSLVKRV